MTGRTKLPHAVNALKKYFGSHMVKRDARKILFQITAEYKDRARQLEEIINAEKGNKGGPQG